MGWYESLKGWISNRSVLRRSGQVIPHLICASAKTNLGERDILRSMNDILEISESSVADLLAATPKAVRFFIDHGTSCATCSLTRFCKLKEVVAAYDLDKDAFFTELAKLNMNTL